MSCYLNINIIKYTLANLWVSKRSRCKKKSLDLQALCIFYIKEVRHPFYQLRNCIFWKYIDNFLLTKGDKKIYYKIRTYKQYNYFWFLFTSMVLMVHESQNSSYKYQLLSLFLFQHIIILYYIIFISVYTINSHIRLQNPRECSSHNGMESSRVLSIYLLRGGFVYL